MIYHYTTIDTLAMILSTGKLKFNRLDKVDDLEELAESMNVKLGKYAFVSCWTEDKEESIPLWKMYSGNNHGVRIGMEPDMFEQNIVSDLTLPNGSKMQGQLTSMLDPNEFLHPDYFIFPFKSDLTELFYCHIEYVDDVKAKTEGAFKIKMTDSEHASSTISFGEIGKYKNKRWAFQQETRFRIYAQPFNAVYGDANIGTIALNSYLENKPLPFSEYFISLRKDAIQNMEITLHPNSTQSDSVIVEALCSRFAPNAIVSDSSLKGVVNLK
jgi:hypothetical protein